MHAPRFFAFLALVFALVVPVRAGALEPAPPAALSVPFLAQTEALCGGAAAAMVLRFWGDRHADVQQFAPLVDRRLGGIAAELVIHLACGAGFVISALAMFDFRTPHWITWIGFVATGGVGTIFLVQGVTNVMPQQAAPSGVRIVSPPGAIRPNATWGVGSRAGDLLFVAGMRGFDPKTNELVAGEEARVRQAFRNMQFIAESEGATLKDAVRLVVYVSDMYRFRPLVNKIQAELWGNGPYPPRTIVEVQRLNQDDIVEIEGTFWIGLQRRNGR